MTSFLLIGALSAVFATLVVGLFVFLKGGKNVGKLSNTMMQYRVMLQGLALIIFFLLVWMRKS